MVANSSNIQTKNFYGAVILRDTFQSPLDGRYYLGVIGMVSIYKDEEMIGFRVHSSDSNWGAHIVGRNGTTLTFPGCQVRGVMHFAEDTACTKSEFLCL